MSIAANLRSNREESKMSVEELADRLGIPEYLVRYMEEPDKEYPELEEVLAEALEISVKEFRGEVRRPTAEEKQDAKATYKAIRALIIDPARCENPPVAREFFGEHAFSEVERSLVQHMATKALYRFCTENCTSFSFDQYLFRRHSELFERLERSLSKAKDLTDEEREERLNCGHADLFACDSMENIAAMILDEFVVELEEKLASGVSGLAVEIGFPLAWNVDKEKGALQIKDIGGRVRKTVSLSGDVASPKADDRGAGKEEKRSGKGEKQPEKSEKQPEKSEKQPERSEKQSERSEKQPEKSEKQPERSEKQSERSEKQSEKDEKEPEKDEKPDIDEKNLSKKDKKRLSWAERRKLKAARKSA